MLEDQKIWRGHFTLKITCDIFLKKKKERKKQNDHWEESKETNFDF